MQPLANKMIGGKRQEQHMQLAIQKNKTLIEFEVTRIQRKTMAIIISPTGKVRVAAPNRISDKEILDWVNSKSNWIVNRLDEINNLSAAKTSREYIPGELFPYLGLDYPLHIETHNKWTKPAADLCCGRLIVATPDQDAEMIRGAIEAWYRCMAGEQIRSRIDLFCPRLNVSPQRVTIKNQKTGWGSCSSKGDLNFNWRAIMAPPQGGRLYRCPRALPPGSPESFGGFLEVGVLHPA